MSQEYMVLIVDEPEHGYCVDGMRATVWMRFTEQPAEDFMTRLANAHPGKRVYCLMGASTWFTSTQ